MIVSGAGTHGAIGARVRRQIAERLDARIEVLDVTGSITQRDRISAGPDLVDALAPAVGVLLRERAAPGERVA